MKKDYRFNIVVAFRGDATGLARRVHWIAGVIRRALRLPGISHVYVDVHYATEDKAV